MIALIKPRKNQYRIYFFFPFYHIGGAEKVHAQIAKATGGKDCVIYFTKKSESEGCLNEFKESGCIIKNISTFTDNKWMYFLNLIYRGIISGYINKQTTKPIVFNGQCNFGYKISPWIIKDIKQVELIHSFNSFSYIRMPFLPFITTTVMISRIRIQNHIEYYKKTGVPDVYIDKIKYISNAIELPIQKFEKTKESFTVLYAGRGSAEKRVPLIAAIANEMQAIGKDIRFEFLGDVSNVISPAAYPFAHFYGNISQPEKVNKIFEKASVLILTSTTEGFPMVVIEAMANACAVIATPVGDIPLHIKNGETGFVFSSVEDEKKIKDEAIKILIAWKQNPALLNSISNNAFQYARNNFGINQFNELYRQVLKY